jgi:hypothetical protein
MTERSKYYPVSIEKLQKASISDLAYLIAPMNIGDDYEYFDEIKHLLDIPKPSKSLEEFKQELDSKFVELLVKTKRKFAVSKKSAEYRFKIKSDNANSRFEYAKKNGEFPQYLSLTTSGNVTIGDSNVLNSYLSVSDSTSSCGTEFNLNATKNSVGYYCVVPDVKFHMTKRPNKIVQFFMRNLLGFKWVDKK